ncbi:MAG: hypothetical protein ACRDIZ_08610 [Actinomycetota bacterium]
MDIERFGQVGLGPGRHELADLALRGIGADHHHRDLPSGGVGLEGIQDLSPEHVGQLKVEKDHIGAVLSGKIKPHPTVHGGDQLDLRTLCQLDPENRTLRWPFVTLGLPGPRWHGDRARFGRGG